MKLKLATYNILWGKKKQKIIQNIKKLSLEGVNVFCLQEVANLGGGKSIVDFLLPVLGSNWKAEKFLSKQVPSYDLGLCVIWDSTLVELTKAEKLPLPKLTSKNFLEKIYERTVKNYQFPIERAALILEFKWGDKILRLINLHLNVSGGMAHKVTQLNFLKSYLEEKPPVANEVICGDFNALGLYLFSKKNALKIASLFGKDFKNALPKPRRTGPLYQNLDYIFTKNLPVLTTGVRRMRGSDHRPVVAEFEI